MKTITAKLTVSLIVIALVIGVITMQDQYFSKSTPAHLVLLLPDAANPDSPKVKVWLDAIKEEGFLVTVMHDSTFLRPWTDRAKFSGVILPDQVHKVASDSLITTLDDYVNKGGKLMLVYDAGVWSLEGRYTSNFSRFSNLAGVTYARYNKLQEKTISWQPLLASEKIFIQLRIPPGKYHQYNNLATKKSPRIDTEKVQSDKTYSMSGYENALISYDIYKTNHKYNGEVLFQSPNGDVIAGQRSHGKGTVLYVNLPLGYLKGRTDGLLLHSFVHYFSNKIVKLPYLTAVPKGVGGIVMNLHLDSNVTFRPLKRIKELGIYNQGPYSIHITAGPDSNFVGDFTGINVPKNKQSQKLIKFFMDKGYEVGSHGGWIHDRFGDHVKNKPTKEFVNYLVKNKSALEKVLGKPVTEYSSPKGNHPEWVTNWLSKNKINSYYFTGNTGMSPTRSYRDGVLNNPNVWSFPILPYRDMAGFEELRDYKIKPDIVKNWLNQTSEFSANTHSIRLIYFHPRGALYYKSAVRGWLKKAKKLQNQKRFRWYTMSAISKFLTKRSKVQWGFNTDTKIHAFTANHPDNLNNFTWLLSADVYDKPNVTYGKAVIKKSNDQWSVVAGKGTELTFTAETINDDE
jgi:hypothetical protein